MSLLLTCFPDFVDVNSAAKRLPRAQPAQNQAGMVLVDRRAEGSRTSSCCS